MAHAPVSHPFDRRFCVSKIPDMKRWIDYFSDHRHLALAVVAVSLATLAFVYIAQYGFNLQPCVLCLYQRKPYIFAAILGLQAFFFTDKNKKATYILLLLCGILFLVGMGIAGFHVGVEQGWWKGLQA